MPKPESFPSDNSDEEKSNPIESNNQPPVEQSGQPQKSNKLSRRGFLKAVGGAVAGLGVVEGGRRVINESLPNSEAIDADYPNIVRVENPRSTYRVVYSSHDTINDPGTLRDADCAILELVQTYPEKDRLRLSEDFFKILPAKQYDEIIPQAYKEKKPLFFVDMSASTEDNRNADMEFIIHGTILPIIEAGLGVGLGLYGGKQIRKKEKTRRDFLKATGAAISATYLIAPAMRVLSKPMARNSEDSVARKLNRVIQHTNELIHPETHLPTVLDLRNTLIAEKSEFVADMMNKELGRKSTSNIYIGAEHIGLEKELQRDPEDRIKTLRNDLDKDFKKEGSIIRVDFVANLGGKDAITVKVFKDPKFND